MDCPSDGTRKFLKAAIAVRLTVVLCDLVYISLEQAVLHCSEPSEIDP